MELFLYINLFLAVCASVLYLRKFFTETKIRLYFLAFAIDSLVIAALYAVLTAGVQLEPYAIRIAFTLLLVTFITSYVIGDMKKDC